MGTKLYIKTFGCQMNEYDSQKTVEILQNKKDMEALEFSREYKREEQGPCSSRFMTV